jgi:iron-sulfur cluster repair protein YtfE (RIC family)
VQSCYKGHMEKLNRITLLDNNNRPKAPKIEGLNAAQRHQGRRLSLFHNMHRRQLAEVAQAIEQIDATLPDKISALDMNHNFKVFGNMCGQEWQMLSGHHGIEDQVVFPMLHDAGSAGLKKVVERLMAEHLVVHELIDELEGLAHQALAEPSPENYALLKNTFKDLNTCVQSHFSYEETELEEALGVIDVGI